MTPQDVDRRITRALARQRLGFRGRTAALNLQARLQRVQLKGLADEILQDVELFQHFGFTSSLPNNTEVIVIPLGGKSGHCVVVASEAGALRFKTEKAGESAIYNQHGDCVYIRDGRIVEIRAGNHVKVEAPSAEFTGDVKVAGKLQVGGDIESGGDVKDKVSSMQSMRDSYNPHNHGNFGADPPSVLME